MNNAACIRSKGYLTSPPYYPDLSRRYFGAYARMIGSDLGASYRVEPKLPVQNLEKQELNPDDEDIETLDSSKAPAAKETARKTK
jgi:hypothetical protein